MTRWRPRQHCYPCMIPRLGRTRAGVPPVHPAAQLRRWCNLYTAWPQPHRQAEQATPRLNAAATPQLMLMMPPRHRRRRVRIGRDSTRPRPGGAFIGTRASPRHLAPLATSSPGSLAQADLEGPAAGLALSTAVDLRHQSVAYHVWHLAARWAHLLPLGRLEAPSAALQLQALPHRTRPIRHPLRAGQCR